jgi:pimeloyl-ACP methyl ester carboxylesterase
VEEHIVQKRVRYLLKWVFLVVLFSILALVLWNQICKHIDSKLLRNAYGQSVEVDGKTMVVDIHGEENDTTIILLPGSASASPVLEFLPLAEALSKHYQVITIEPFGYGLSDTTDASRDLDTVVNELHQCVSTLGCDRYYLMAHSLSGLYSLYWANTYPEEVLGFIGIDCSVPGQNKENPYPISITTINKISAYIQKTINVLGISRLQSINDPQGVILADFSYNYSEEQLNVYRTLTLDCSYNKTIMNEQNCFDAHLETVAEMKFPENLPVLQFVASSNCEVMAAWEQLHIDVIAESEYSDVIIMEGGHYLHFVKKTEIAETVNQWIVSLPSKGEPALS